MTVKELTDILDNISGIDGVGDQEIQIVNYAADSDTEGERLSVATVSIGDGYVAIDPFEKGVG